MLPIDDDPEQRTLRLVYSAPEPDEGWDITTPQLIALVFVCVIIGGVIGFGLFMAMPTPPL